MSNLADIAFGSRQLTSAAGAWVAGGSKARLRPNPSWAGTAAALPDADHAPAALDEARLPRPRSGRPIR